MNLFDALRDFHSTNPLGFYTALAILVLVLAHIAASVLIAWKNAWRSPFGWIGSSRIWLCTTPIYVAALVVGVSTGNYLGGRGGFRLGVDLSGGTILVYEVDKDNLANMTEQARSDLLAHPEQLAASLKRRIDPADLYNVTIRPLPAAPGAPPRVEIILPTGGRVQQEKEGAGKSNFTEDEIENIKNLIQQQGRLEFRILANSVDDSDAITAAENTIAKHLTKVEGQKTMEDLNKDGAPLPPPTYDGSDRGDREFTAKLDGNPKYKYSWVEIGKEELYSMQLNSLAETTPATDPDPKKQAAKEERRKRLWEIVKQNRDKTPFLDPEAGSVLLYCRTIPDPKDTKRVPPNDQLMGKKVEWFVLTREPPKGTEVTGDFLTSVVEGQSEGKRAADFSFNSEGAERFRELTTLNRPSQTNSNDPESGFHRLLAVVLDNQVRSAPRLNGIISTNGQIAGEFTAKELDDLVRILRAGALPATLKREPVSENTMGATLGADTIAKGAMSIGLAFAAVLIFMLVYYRFAGIVACIALLANLLLTVAFMVLVQAAFTLPGLAGLVLMLGMAVDANVLIYERLREERERGASLALAIRNGYDRAFPTIIDTHMTSIFTAIVLYVVGNDQLKGFGISLTVGLIISLFTSLVLTRTLFDIWLSRNWIHKLTFMQLFKRPNINFMKIRYYMFGLTVGLTVAGAILFVYHLGNGGLNIDFVGGTAYSGQLVHPVGLTELRTRLQPRLTPEAMRQIGVKADLPDASIEQVFINDPKLSQGENSALFTVRTSEKDAGTVQMIVNYKLGPDWGKHVGDKDDSGDLLKRVMMKEPTIISDGNQAKVAVLDFVKSTDDFAAPEQKKAALDKVRAVLEKDLGVSGLTINQDEGVKDFFALKVSLPKDATKTVKEVQDGLDKARADLSGQGLEMTNPAVEAKEGAPLAATLKFPQPQPDYALKAQVERLATAALNKRGITKFQFGPPGPPDPAHPAGSPASTVPPWDVGRKDRYSRLVLTLGEKSTADDPTKDTSPVDNLRAALTEVNDQFSGKPQPERLENFDSQLARDTQEKALYAILASWIAILVYLWFRFGSWTFGAATVLCLIHDLFFTLGAIAVCHYIYAWMPGLAYYLGVEDFKIDLPSVAALLTLVGYSVSDTIVVFDRIREVRGKNPLLTYTMINDSVNQTLSRTILSSLTVFLVVGVLYVFGGEGVHLFAFVMVVGVVVGTYSSIYIASPLLIMFGEGLPKTERAKAAAAQAAAAHA